MPSEPPLRLLHGLTIVVVDDHRDTVTMLVDYLGLAGASVLGAFSAAPGLKLAETHMPDAILTDLRLQGEDGRWLLGAVRMRPLLARIPVYAMSGGHEAWDATSGFGGYFLKPVDLDALVVVLGGLPLPRSLTSIYPPLAANRRHQVNPPSAGAPA